jgi:hypothetical protein
VKNPFAVSKKIVTAESAEERRGKVNHSIPFTAPLCASLRPLAVKNLFRKPPLDTFPIRFPLGKRMIMLAAVAVERAFPEGQGAL